MSFRAWSRPSGSDVAELTPGDEIFALTPFDRDGVAAEYAAVPADVLAPKPQTIDHVESAAIPMGALTAWQGLFVRGGSVRINAC
jgi:NADPH:quinone reductase-like Zn-dependent oxidoreductase